MLNLDALTLTVRRHPRPATLTDLLFEAETWTIGYAVLEWSGLTGGLPVVLSVQELGTPDPDTLRFQHEIDPEALAAAPRLRTTTSRLERDLHKYYPQGTDWVLSHKGNRVFLPPDPVKLGEEPAREAPWWRSAREFKRYRAWRGTLPVGKVKTLYVRPGTWSIVRVCVELENMLPRHLLLSPEQLEGVRWFAGRLDLPWQPAGSDAESKEFRSKAGQPFTICVSPGRQTPDSRA